MKCPITELGEIFPIRPDGLTTNFMVYYCPLCMRLTGYPSDGLSCINPISMTVTVAGAPPPLPEGFKAVLRKDDDRVGAPIV